MNGTVLAVQEREAAGVAGARGQAVGQGKQHTLIHRNKIDYQVHLIFGTYII